MYDKLAMKSDLTVQGLTKDQWMDKDIVECINDPGDPECNLEPGSMNDLAIVSYNQVESKIRIGIISCISALLLRAG